MSLRKTCNQDREKEHTIIEAVRAHMKDFEYLNDFWHYESSETSSRIALIIFGGLNLYAVKHNAMDVTDTIISNTTMYLIAFAIFLSLLLTGIMNFRFWKLVVDTYVSEDMNTESTFGRSLRHILSGKEDIGYQIMGNYICSEQVLLFVSLFTLITQMAVGNIVEESLD